MPTKKKKLCFVLMPFKKDMKEVYRDAIKPACEQAGFNSLRVDELKGAFNINRKIIEFIFKSDAIIADLSGWNPNVFYEMGVAHAIDNKTIMIIQEQDKLPFDVSTYNCIKYEQTKDGLDKLKHNIADFLLCLNDWRKHATNPVQDFKPFDTFVPVSKINDLQKQIKDKEKLLKQTVPKQEWQTQKEKITELKKKLEKRPSFDEVGALNNQLKELRSELKKKRLEIQIIKDEADKKKQTTIKQIIPPEGMVHIPAGEFTMGTSEKQIEKYLKEHKDWEREWFEDEKPAHNIWLDDFFMDKYLVTNAQYAEFLNDWGKEKDKDGNKMIDKHEWGVHKKGKQWEPQKEFENFPVIYVTWYGAQQYAKWAKKKLPSEAQWEKAARGGKGFEYATRDGNINNDLANYNDKVGKTSSVGNYSANPYGVFDMSGNVWEWCLDWFGENYYKDCPEKNPLNLKKGDYRVVRGGSWSFADRNLRCANRFRDYPWFWIYYVGFRCTGAYL